MKSEGHPWEQGLGEFELKRLDKNEIFMKRKKQQHNHFNSIRIIEFKGRELSEDKFVNIEDFNRLAFNKRPTTIPNNFVAHKSTLMQTANLIINTRNSEVRNIIYNCISIEALQRIMMPEREGFLPIANIIPVGILGGTRARPQQNCQSMKKFSKNQVISFANWGIGDKKQLIKYFENFKLQYGVKIKVIDFTMSEMVQLVLQGKLKNHLFLAGIDAVMPSLLPFLDAIIDPKKRIITYDIPNALNLYLKLKKQKEDNISLKQITEILEVIQKSYHVLPLFQEVRDFYYPMRVKNIQSGKDFLEYPDVSKFII